MTNTLTTPRTAGVLARLFAAAQAQEAAHERDDSPPPVPPESLTAQELADARQDAYMPVSADGGRLLYALTRAIRPQTVVEFGTSFGISTIFLAAAVIDNGTGQVVSTELSAVKVDRARQNLSEAGVDGPVTVLPGAARDTLGRLPGPIGLVLLDGWKDLYRPVLALLEPKLSPGALVIADDTSFASVADYLSYIRDPAHGYVSVSFPVEDGMEISSGTGGK